MPFFGSSSSQPFAKEIEQATDVNNTLDDWSLILSICDKAVNYSDGAKSILKSIVKRMLHSDPHVSMQALTLLDACVNNSGKSFHLEMCTKDFISDVRKLLAKGHPKVTDRMKQLIRTWSEDIFKEDPKLCLIPALYYKLRSEGVEFPESEPPPKKEILYSADPNVVSSQQEEDDISKAIEISLKDTGPVRNKSFRECASAFAEQSVDSQEPIKVRALYDFEAVEGNELTLKTGEIVLVLNSSDENWWRGSNHRGEGLFPANFVTKDLNAQVNVSEQLSDSPSTQVVAEVHQEQTVVEINEDKINEALHLLEEADPTGEIPDPPEMAILEAECNEMSPLIDKELQIIDKKLSRLTSLNMEIVDAVNQFYEFSRQAIKPNIYYPLYHPSQMMSSQSQQHYPIQFPGQVSSTWPHAQNIPQNDIATTSNVAHMMRSRAEQSQSANLTINPVPTNLKMDSTVPSSLPSNTSGSEMMPPSVRPVQFDARNVPLMPSFGLCYQVVPQSVPGIPVSTNVTSVPNYYYYTPSTTYSFFTTSQNPSSVPTSCGTYTSISNLAPERTVQSSSSELFSTPGFDLITGNLTAYGDSDTTVPLMCKVVDSSENSSSSIVNSHFAVEADVQQNTSLILPDNTSRSDLKNSSVNREMTTTSTHGEHSVSAESDIANDTKLKMN